MLLWRSEDVIRLAYQYHSREWKGKERDAFFRGVGMSRVTFDPLMRDYKISVTHYYSVNNGRLYKMLQQRSDRRGWADRAGDGYCRSKRSGKTFTPELILELTHVHLSHYYDGQKGFNEVLKEVGISKNHYLLLRRKYGYQIQFFVQIEGFEIVPRYAGQ